MAEDKICVEITVNASSNLEGVDEYVKSLDEVCLVQLHKKWVPAFSILNEIWITTIIGSAVLKFINDIVIPGLIWDATKSAASRFFKRTAELTESNAEDVDLQRLTLSFDDIKINILGVGGKFTSIVSHIFQTLSAELPRIQGLGITGIRTITMPVDRNDEGVYYRAGFDFDPVPTLWEIEADFGCTKYYYDVATHQLTES